MTTVRVFTTSEVAEFVRTVLQPELDLLRLKASGVPNTPDTESQVLRASAVGEAIGLNEAIVLLLGWLGLPSSEGAPAVVEVPTPRLSAERGRGPANVGHHHWGGAR